jgi:hypothetical protein
MRKKLTDNELHKRIVDEKDEELLFETVADINMRLTLLKLDLKRQEERLHQVMEVFKGKNY